MQDLNYLSPPFYFASYNVLDPLDIASFGGYAVLRLAQQKGGRAIIKSNNKSPAA